MSFNPADLADLEVQIASSSRGRPVIHPYTLDDNMQLVLNSHPTCVDNVFMLLLCVGCFISETLNIVFDDKSKTLTRTQYCGYMFCFAKTEVIHYSEIDSFAIEFSNHTVQTRKNGPKKLLYYPVVVLKDQAGSGAGANAGRRYTMGGYMGEDTANINALKLHQFIFGYNNPKYRAPISCRKII